MYVYTQSEGKTLVLLTFKHLAYVLPLCLTKAQWLPVVTHVLKWRLNLIAIFNP